MIPSSSLLVAQQLYVGKATSNCDSTDNSTSVLGYTCNGKNPTCQSYLIFRSQPLYKSVYSISNLLGSDPSHLAQLNSVSETATFEINREVIVPINCSCSGQYYLSNASHVLDQGSSYFTVANDVYQGLSTCQALKDKNGHLSHKLVPGMKITVPLRCACPTTNQSSDGVKFLLSYLVKEGDSISKVSKRFGVDTGSTLDANELTEKYSIYPSTTLLIPFKNPPSSSQAVTPIPPPPSTPPRSSTFPLNRSSRKTWLHVVIGVSAFGVVLAASLLFTFLYKRGRTNLIFGGKDLEKAERPMEKLEGSKELLAGLSDISRGLKVYEFEELLSATENFSCKCRIKGSVYRGIINGDVAAIKKMKGNVSEEINILKSINHCNTIGLLGICFNHGDWYLVYEYAENGPLSDWINGRDDSKALSWMQRVQIALDVANGLNYLHIFTEPAHVHKDIKSRNILLNRDFRAKIASFGMARTAEGKEGGFTWTRRIVGTKGYMAPEYLQNGLITPKLDVYAFGVVLLQLVTGKVNEVTRGAGTMLFSETLINVLSEENKKEKLIDYMDPSLEGNYPLDLALSMVRLVEGCLRKDAKNRLSMNTIVKSLSKIQSASLSWELSNKEKGFLKLHDLTRQAGTVTET